MNQEELTKDITEAARRSFSDLFTQHGDETFYAFALYTDEDCYTVAPAANSLEQYQTRTAKRGETNLQNLAYYKWASAEWAYESFAAEPFNAICEQLSEACTLVSSDAAAFAAFKADVHRAMVEALKRLDAEGFYGKHRNRAVLFITSSDYDEAKAMEDGSAATLNPPEIYEAFHRRYDATA